MNAMNQNSPLDWKVHPRYLVECESDFPELISSIDSFSYSLHLIESEQKPEDAQLFIADGIKKFLGRDVLNGFKSLSNEDFISLVLFILFAGMKGLASDAFTARWGIDVAINIESMENIPKQCVRWDIFKGDVNKLIFTFNPNFFAQEGVKEQLTIFNWTSSLFISYINSQASISGSTFLSLWDTSLHPGISFCTNSDNHFLVPDCMFLSTKGYKSIRDSYNINFIDWHKRKDIVFWRGATTGVVQQGGAANLPRVKLCNLIKTSNEVGYDVGISQIVQIREIEEIKYINSLGILKDYVPPLQNISYKYQIDIDGNTNAWPGLFHKLLSGSLVFKIESDSCHRQWYYDRLLPWENFIPISADLQDLLDKVKFIKKNDLLAEAIGASGRKLALSLTYEEALEESILAINQAVRHQKYSTSLM